MSVRSRSNSNLEVLVIEKKKKKSLRARERTNHKLNPHMPGFEPGARVTTALSSYFGDRHGDLVYKEMYGAKIIFENGKSSRLPVKFAAIASISRKCP